MHCPRCADRPLEHVAFGRQTRVEWCTGCGGAWYEAGELERALGIEGPAPVAGEGTGLKPGITCPTCQTPTAEVTWPQHGHVRVDACTRCGGRWLDKGELEAVRRALVARGLAEPPVSGAVDGEPVRIPVAQATRAARRLEWRWVALGAAVMLVTWGAVLGTLRFLHLFDAMRGHEGAGPSAAAAGAGLLAFPLGGLLIGRGSSGFTVWEAALAAIPVSILAGWVGRSSMSPGQALALVVAGFVLALLGAAAGERLSHR